MKRIKVDLNRQVLSLVVDNEPVRTWRVSTAKNGPGEIDRSFRTPRGRHAICAKIGSNAELGAVFVDRVATGETWSPELAAANPARDWILTRILWLEGLESGFNRGGNVDTKRRCIYIHGTSETASLGTPASHGCIRMDSRDIVALYDAVEVGTEVEIID